MYTEVSKEYIFPGLTLCDDLSIEARKNDAQAVMDKKLEDLTTYTNEAQKGVKTKVLAVGGNIHLTLRLESYCSLMGLRIYRDKTRS